MDAFSFQIVTPEKIVYKGQITSLVVPGQEGYLGIWAKHARMLATLAAGEVKIKEGGREAASFAITGGLLEVERNGATILADAAEKSEEIDIERAEAARKRALERLSKKSTDIDITRAQAALMRATNRLHTASKKEQ